MRFRVYSNVRVLRTELNDPSSPAYPTGFSSQSIRHPRLVIVPRRHHRCKNKSQPQASVRENGAQRVNFTAALQNTTKYTALVFSQRVQFASSRVVSLFTSNLKVFPKPYEISNNPSRRTKLSPLLVTLSMQRGGASPLSRLTWRYLTRHSFHRPTYLLPVPTTHIGLSVQVAIFDRHEVTRNTLGTLFLDSSINSGHRTHVGGGSDKNVNFPQRPTLRSEGSTTTTQQSKPRDTTDKRQLFKNDNFEQLYRINNTRLRINDLTRTRSLTDEPSPALIHLSVVSERWESDCSKLGNFRISG